MSESAASQPTPEFDSRLTQVLQAAGAGDRAAAEQLLTLVYDELRQLAAARLAHVAPGHTLQATALVHEAYLRLVGPQGAEFANRKHFFFAASRAMKSILVDHARRKYAQKRGGNHDRISLEFADLRLEAPTYDLLALGEALEELERVDELGAQLVMLRFFAGLEVGEAAEVLETSRRTVERKWRFVRLWLRNRLSDEPAADEREEASDLS